MPQFGPILPEVGFSVSNSLFKQMLPTYSVLLM